MGGCFDFIHFGHVQFLTTAKTHGDHLVVALESDENVAHMKGPNRPIHTQAKRKAMLEALTVVDEVLTLPLMKTDNAYTQLVERVSPSIIAATQEDPILDKKQTQADLVGAKLVVIPKVKTPSTSKLMKLLELE